MTPRILSGSDVNLLFDVVTTLFQADFRYLRYSGAGFFWW